MNNIAGPQLVALLVICSAIGPAHAEKDAVRVKDIVDGSRHIVVGKVVGFRDTNETIKGYVAVLARVQILEVLKGNLKVNGEITVLTTSLETGRILPADERIILRKNDLSLLFVNPHAKDGGSYQTYSFQNGAVSLLFRSTKQMIQLGKYLEKVKGELSQ